MSGFILSDHINWPVNNEPTI